MDSRLEPGARIGVFEVLETLGSGGMGEVYRARDTKLGRNVALKTLPAALADQPARLARLRKEARILAALNHPHIATLFGLEESDGAVALVMELVECRTLADRIRLQPPSVREALELARQIAAALEAAHEKGVLHRDLKPANIVIDGKGQAKLLDFGLATIADEELANSHDVTASAMSSDGHAAGTAPYMSPEQARGEPLDKRTDVWAFGCVLHEMLTGRRAFPGASWAETMAAILEREPEWAVLPDSTPPNARRLLERCLQKDRERRLRDIGDARLELEELLTPGRSHRRRDEDSPYPGLAPFAETAADDFFGREAEVESLWRKLRAKTLLALIGPSGAGKTSFVRAGIVASRPDDWAAIVATPGDAPMRRLGEALAPALAGDPGALHHLVRFDDPPAAFEALVRWRKRHAGALLVVDQFEELFTLNTPEVQDRFTRLLGRLATEDDVHVLLALRDDFLMACQGHEVLAEVFADLTPLGPPGSAALRRALVEPAARRGYRFEDDTLVSDMLAAVEGERGALPLLGFAAARLWERRDTKVHRLSRRAYEEIGGVGGALARHAEATLDRIGASRRDQVREIFRNLVTSHGTRAVVDHDELLSVFPDRSAGEPVLDALIDARLLTAYEVTAADGTSRRQQIEIVHESLLTEWPRLVRWQTQDADGAQLREQLRQAAHVWDERGRSDDLLWTGAAFREYQVWRDRYAGGLTELEDAFATAMTARELRTRRRRRAAVAALIGALAVGLTVMGALWRRSMQETRRAQTEVLRAEAAKVLALGRLELEAYPTAALAYATRSLELADTLEARQFVLEALSRGPTAFILPLPGDVSYYNVDFSPDGKWLATGSLGDQVLVWPFTGTNPIVLGGHEATGSYRRVEFGPASDLLVTRTLRTDPLRIWSIPEARLLRQIDLAPGTSFFVRGGRLLTFTPSLGGAGLFRPWPLREGPAHHPGLLLTTDVEPEVDKQGKWLGLARGRQVLLRPVDGPESTRERLVGTHPDRVTAIGFGPDHRIVSRDEKGEMRIWTSASNISGLWRVLHGPIASRAWFCLDETASWFATGVAEARSVRLWDLSASRETEPLELRRGDSTRIQQLDITTTMGQWLVAANQSSVSFWPLQRRYARVLSGHNGDIRQVRFAPDGSWIATASLDGTVRVWPLSSDATWRQWVAAGTMPNSDWRKRSNSRGEMAYGLAVDPSGRRLLAAFTDHQAFVLDLERRSPPARLEPMVSSPFATAFDREGRRAAVGPSYTDTTSPGHRVVRIWDVGSRKVLKDLQLVAVDTAAGERNPMVGGVVSLEFAPNGRLYSAGSGGVRSWDIERETSEIVVEGKYMLMDLGEDGRTLLAATRQGPRPDAFPSTASIHTLEHHRSQPLATHGTTVMAVGLDPTATIAVTGSADGIVRVGRVSGEEPHQFFGHRGAVHSVAISPDGRWIATGGQDGLLRLWPMPDVSKPPLHTLPHDALLAKLKSLTNLRVVADTKEATGYRLDVGPFPGWQSAPAW